MLFMPASRLAMSRSQRRPLLPPPRRALTPPKKPSGERSRTWSGMVLRSSPPLPK